MTKLNFIINYVEDAPKAAELYGKILELKPVESSPNWAMFIVPDGPVLGLWSRRDIDPKPDVAGGGSELCIEVPEDADVGKTLKSFEALGLNVLQQPTTMDFGLTFTAADPDGNRLRVYSSNRR
jgi:catechol 2,3-dioxygenase-like lactoylglutathione lyase family enzyme